MNKEIEIPEGYQARIAGNKIIIELKESEDEKIRTRLIALVESFGQGTYKNEMLAYLEKQKEQKPESCDCSRDEESYTNGIHHVLMNPEAYGLIKQKPAEQLDGTFTSYDMAKTFMEGQNYVIAHPEKFGLCKPAEWKEEDEGMMDNLIQHLKVAYSQCDWLDKTINWLKSLRPQPKQEWREGTKKALDKISDYLKYKGREEDADFIKHLSPQPHWKPSEEQMKALKVVARGFPTDDPDAIDSLLTDLQKLL